MHASANKKTLVDLGETPFCRFCKSSSVKFAPNRYVNITDKRKLTVVTDSKFSNVKSSKITPLFLLL